MANQIIETVKLVQHKAIRDVEEKMQAKIERVSEKCSTIETHHIPNIQQCTDVKELEELITNGNYQQAITQFYMKDQGKLRTEAQFIEA